MNGSLKNWKILPSPSEKNLPLQKVSFLFKAEPLYEVTLKVILLLQVSRRDFEPTLIIVCLY